MKRSILTVLFCIVFIIFMVNPSASHAATPTPTPTPTTAGLPTDMVEIRNNIPNKQIVTEPELQEISLSPTPGIEYHYEIPGLNPNVENFNIPAMDNIADWLTKTSPYMTAKQIKDNVIPHQPDNLFVSGRTKRCVYIGGILSFQDEGYYETEHITYLPPLTTANGLLASHLVRYAISPTNGKYNFTGPAYRIDNTEMDCTLTGPGTIQNPPKTVKLVAGSWIARLLGTLRELLKIKVVYVSKQQTPEGERIHCLLNGCVKDAFTPDYNIDYIQDAKEKERVKQSGGIVDAGFRAVFMDTTKGESAHGQEPNFTDTNTVNTKQKENSADLIKCSLVPKALRGALGLTEEKCNGFVKDLQTPTSCGLPSVSADTACKLCNSDAFATDADILTSFEMSTLPNGLPQKAIQVLEAAAQTYQVPAAMLLAIMLNEGSFEHPGVWDWTDENVDKWSQCGAEMPKCEDFAHPVTNAKGPFGFLKSDWAAVKEAVLKYDPNRPKDKLSPCNFVDAAFASAKEIHDDQSHLYVDQTRYGMPPDSCLGTQIYKGRDIPATCSVWTPERVALTEWQYGERICNRTISSAVSIFKRYSCR